MPIDFDIRSVPSDHNIWILHKVTPLDLLAQVAVLFFNSPMWDC